MANAEALLALDESVGRVLDHLKSSGFAIDTLVIYMGDNGLVVGEHALIDKRNADEESIRVSMFAWAPSFIKPGTTIEALVRNIDVAPTVLELTGRIASRARTSACCATTGTNPLVQTPGGQLSGPAKFTFTVSVNFEGCR